jgi:hypothetical protein
MTAVGAAGERCHHSDVWADLVDDDLLQLGPDERLWKLFCFRSATGRAAGLRHRIYTKLKTDGRLALVTFAAHTPAPGRVVRSSLARVADLPVEALNQIIAAIQRGADAADECEEIDLSSMATLEEQLAQIAQKA